MVATRNECRRTEAEVAAVEGDLSHSSCASFRASSSSTLGVLRTGAGQFAVDWMHLRMRTSGSSGQGVDYSCRVWTSSLGGRPRAFVGPSTHSRKLQSYGTGTSTAAATLRLTPTRTPTPPSACGRVSKSIAGNRAATASAAASLSFCPTTTKGLPRPLLPYDKPQSAAPSIALSSNTRIRFYSHQPLPPPPAASTPASASAPASHPLPIMAYEGKWTAQTVRKTFLKYFEERDHTIGTILHGHTHPRKTNNLLPQCPPDPSSRTPMTQPSSSPTLV